MADAIDRKKRGLGRGLEALIPGGQEPAAGSRELLRVPIEKLRPMSGGQPRRRFDEAKLEELVGSIREHGILQPLLVRPVPGGFEIVAGERRWRAAQRAGLLEVPIIVRERTGADEAFEIALVENLQRDDLNAIEAASGYRRLMDEFGYTHERLATRVGKDRTTITNSLRLLKLPAKVQTMVSDGDLSEGHARALLGLEDAGLILQAAERIRKAGLSVRQAEAIARAGKAGRGAKAKPRESAEVRDLVEKLQRALGARVKVIHRNGRGRIEIRFASLDELDRILDKLM